jgi:Cys-rich repeat protein
MKKSVIMILGMTGFALAMYFCGRTLPDFSYTDQDCAEGEVCRNNRCHIIYKCTDDSDCPEGMVCELWRRQL